MKTYRFGFVALVLGAAAAFQLPAQARPAPRRAAAPQGAPAQQQSPRGVGRGGGGGPAGMILGRGAQLNLTDDQVKKLQALQEGQKDARPSETTMMRLRADLMDANKGEGNLEAARTALDKISKARNDEVIAGMKSRKDARDVLTVAQRAQLDRMGGGMRPGGMRQGGMRQGGMRQRMQGRMQMRQRMQGMRGRGMGGPGGMGGRGMGGPGMGGGRGMSDGMGGPGMGGAMRFRRMQPGMGPGGAGFGMPGMRGNRMRPGNMGPGDMGPGGMGPGGFRQDNMRSPGDMNPDMVAMRDRRFNRRMDGSADGPNGPPRAARVPPQGDNPPAPPPARKPPADSVPPTER